MFVAIPLQTFASDKTSYQGVKLSKPKKENNFYLINNRSELLWWAVNDQNVDIKIMADINVQGNKQLLKADGKTLALGEKEIVVWPCVYYRASNMKIIGNKHTISGIYQKGGYGVDKGIGSFKKYDYVGFISWTMTKTTITDLNIADSYLEGKYAGGFIGQKSKNGSSTALSEYNNCSFHGYVKGNKYAGGFVGWYRMDGQDGKFYRCFNYGTVESGSSLSTNKDVGAGGLIGYLDITHACFAKSNTNFNRCVNYGTITCLTPGGNVGGLIGKVWEYNNGKREWRFCFNMGDVNKYDSSNKKLAGSGLIGKYTNTNGKAKPQVLGCGNAKNSDTGALVDDMSWNYGDKDAYQPINFVGSKTVSNSKLYSSFEKNTSAASWMTNHWGEVTVTAVIILIAMLTAGIGAYMGVTVQKFLYWTGSIADKLINTVGLMTFTHVGELVAVSATLKGAILVSVVAGLLAGAITTASYRTYDYVKSLHRATTPEVMANMPVVYKDNDLRTAQFAYDAKLMMAADSIGGEVNEDKSILFKQHIDANDSTKNDKMPSIITDFTSNVDRIYFGYDGCKFTPVLRYDPNLRNEPIPHQFDSNGECTYCHLKREPLGIVYKDGGIIDYYTIANYEQLLYLAGAFNGENETAYEQYKGATFKVTADITLPEEAGWCPIGSTTIGYADKKWHPFVGKFDGQGHTISGLKTVGTTNYAGLFGYVESNESSTNSEIKNINLANCVFYGKIVGTIAGCLENKKNAIIVDKVASDTTNFVMTAEFAENSYGGGLFGQITRLDDASNSSYVNIRCSYSNAFIISMTNNDKPENELGTFVGKYDQRAASSAKSVVPTFEHCYYSGSSLYTNKAIGNYASAVANDYPLFNDSYSLGDEENENGSITPYYIEANYIKSARLAYNLMQHSRVVENGDTTYYFAQKNGYPVLTNTKQPTLCKVIVGERSMGIQIADTIININETKLAAPIEYAGLKFDKAVLYGWNNEELEGDPVYKGQLNDFSELYKTPTRYYAIVVNPDDIPAIANIQSETEWKGAGVLAGYQQTNIMENLYLQGTNAWSLQLAPQCIDGNNKTVRAGMPLISNVEDATSAARRYSRARGVGARASQETADITIQNARVVSDTLSKNILNKGDRTLHLKNLILMPLSEGVDHVILDWNSETQKENTVGYDLKNVICQKWDSTAVTFYQDGSEISTTTFSDKDKNNDYEHILSYLLSHDGMLDVFGVRLSDKNEKVAGKLGFANEEDKQIYRATLYNQSTGLADGEVLMNYDGEIVFDVKDNRLGAMHEGVPDGMFAVLPLTKEELGDDFINLGKNIITKDGEAACIRLEEGKTDGFAYPSCFDADKELVLSANRIEYVRKVHRDGLHETIYLPCAFNSVEFDEKDFNDEDQVEISFMNRHADGEGIPDTPSGLSDDGKSISLMSLRSYYAKKYADGYDPSQEIDSTDIFRQAFYAGIPYMIAFKCAERTDEMSTVTFVGTNGEYGIGFMREEDPVDPEDPFAPLYGTFHTKVAGEIAKGMKIFGLDVFTNEETGNLYDKFVRLKDTDRIEAFRCFIATNSSLVGDDISIKVDEGTSTGIKDIMNSSQKKNGRIFDISGRRVTKKIPHNIYIQNGKKVVNF